LDSKRVIGLDYYKKTWAIARAGFSCDVRQDNNHVFNVHAFMRVIFLASLSIVVDGYGLTQKVIWTNQ
jgi:hypothetical protein